MEVNEIFPELIESQFAYHIIKKTGQRINFDGELEVRSSHIFFQKDKGSHDGSSQEESSQEEYLLLKWERKESELLKSLESFSIEIPDNWVGIDDSVNITSVDEVFTNIGHYDSSVVVAPGASVKEIYNGIRIYIEPLDGTPYENINLDGMVNLYLESHNLHQQPVINDIVLDNNINAKELIYDVYPYINENNVGEYDYLLREDETTRYTYFVMNDKALYLISFMNNDDLHNAILNSLKFAKVN